MNDFNSIDIHELDTVTGGRNLGPAIAKAKEWGGKAWNAAEKAVTGLGIADGVSRAWDWATGGNRGGEGGGAPAQSAPPQGGGGSTGGAEAGVP